MNTEDDRRDYNINEYQDEEDQRFIIAKKECIFAQTLCLAAILVEFTLAYILCPKDIDQLTYILGFPTWFFVSSCVALGAFVIMLVFCAKFSKRFSLSARADAKEEVKS